MLIATNRHLNVDKVTDGKGNEDSFGEIRGEELRLAVAAKQPGGGWRVELLDQVAFLEAARAGSKSCVFYIHGFNKSFVETLEQAAAIENLYDVDVIPFSWPSLPEAVEIKEAYLKVRAVAEASSTELDALLQWCEKVGSLPGDQQRSVNLLAHSEGNYLLQKYLESSAFQAGETRGLTNVVLSQADVESENHQAWVAKLEADGPAVYVTINRHDKKLHEVEEEGHQPKRLGNSAPSDVQTGITYVDFTEGEHVNTEHTLWQKAIANDAVKSFFAAVLNGKRFPDLADAHWHCRVLALDRE